MKNEVLFFSGQGNHHLGSEILLKLSEYLGKDCRFSHINFAPFPDGESDNQIPKFEEIAGKTVVFYQSISNISYLLEALELIWALKFQYGAARLIAVIPFLIYRRQDHEENQKEIFRLKMVIHMLKSNGADELITVTPHSQKMAELCSEEGLKMVEVDISSLFASAIQGYGIENYAVYAPDKGSIPRAIKLARQLDAPVIFSLKSRGLSNEAVINQEDELEILDTISFHSSRFNFSDIHFANEKQIKGRMIVMVEDEVSTGGTAKKTCVRLKRLGAKDVLLMATHPVLIGSWRRQIIEERPFFKIFMGNTLLRGYDKFTGGAIHDISVADLVAQALNKRIQAPAQ